MYVVLFLWLCGFLRSLYLIVLFISVKLVRLTLAVKSNLLTYSLIYWPIILTSHSTATVIAKQPSAGGLEMGNGQEVENFQQKNAD